jgi:hypothetical protein
MMKQSMKNNRNKNMLNTDLNLDLIFKVFNRYL